jgi:archaellum component FlaC
MTQDEIKALIEDLRLNHEFCPKEVILQAADELERMQQGIETLHALYEQAVKQRDYLMDQQRAQVEGSNMLPYQFARAIEAKLREKNS